jgi:hypothetical protein
MGKNKKSICIIIALFLLINFFMIIPSGASQDNLNQNTQPVQQENDAPESPDDTESQWYSEKLSLKKEHQKLLWDYCNKRNLDYIDMLSLIFTESNFNEKCSTGKYKGYFQISKTNCENLAKSLKTSNSPLDGTININWGTYIFAGILKDKRVIELQGKKKRDVALSIFQRGTGGYDKYGISYRFLKMFYKKRDIVCSYFE